MRSTLVIALLLAAPLFGGCERKPRNSMAEPTPTPTPSAAPVLGPGAAGETTTTAVEPGALRTLDRAVGCDNTALCQMASLTPERGDPPAMTMALLRQPGDRGAIDLAFETVGDGPAVRPVAVAVDDA